MTKWYSFLNGIKFASPTRAVIYRVWLDQAVLTPVAVAFFFGSMSTLEGKPGEAVARIKAVGVPLLNH
jgi:protein Mpv17